jgi:hypothetical protein
MRGRNGRVGKDRGAYGIGWADDAGAGKEHRRFQDIVLLLPNGVLGSGGKGKRERERERVERGKTRNNYEIGRRVTKMGKAD